MKILILGNKGMLGHMVLKYFQEKKYKIETIDYRWLTESFKNSVESTDADFLINCIGSIPQRKNDFSVNYELPIWLDQNFNGKIIHPGTDCEIDNDEYGISKRKASDWLKLNSKRTKILKSSIIGPELNSTASLMEWVLSNPDNSEIRGYDNHWWNGNTTLEWAKISENMIKDWDKYPIESIYSCNCLNKYELVSTIVTLFKRNIKVNKFSTEKEVSKCLDGIFTKNIDEQLKELVEFYKKK
jgi:dTDP-4-dehydrorhamnose reductase